MKAARIVRVLELFGAFIPGVHELTLLVPAFFGLYYAVRALGLGVDLEPEVVAGISVTFSCLVLVIFNGWVYSGTEGTAEATSAAPRDHDSSSAGHRGQRLETCPAPNDAEKSQFQEEMDSVHVR